MTPDLCLPDQSVGSAGALISQGTLTVLVYAILCSSVVYFLIAFMSWKQRHQRAALSFAVLMLASGIYSLGYFLELHSAGPAEVFIWLRLQYTGIAFIPALWLLFVVQYTDHEKWLRAPFITALFTIPVTIFFMVLTNDLHQLYYTGIQAVTIHGYTVSSLGKGPWYWVNTIYYNVALLVGCITLFNAFLYGNAYYRRRHLLLFLGILTPWVCFIIYQAGGSPLNLDLGPFGLIVAGLLSAYYLYGFKPFDLIPVTRFNFFESTQDGYMFLDSLNRVIDMNGASLELLGINHAAVGRNVREIFAASTGGEFQLQKGDLDAVEGCHYLSGSKRWIEATSSPIVDRQGRTRATMLRIHEITERMRIEAELKYHSLHDTLTGIYNRSYFEEELRRLEGGRDYPVTVLSADLDGLKLINDIMGHRAGDGLLKACAEVLKGSLRTADAVARVGGDEFAVILPRTGESVAASVVKRIRFNIDRFNEGKNSFPLSISLGMATARNSGTPLQEIFRRADDQMYHDKLSRGGDVRSKTVQALLAALSERDHSPAGHDARMAELCRHLGTQAGLSSRQIDDLDLLARVHDLGNLSVPRHILDKKEPLTEGETEIIRLHPEKGYRIAASFPELAAVADLILKHHERWDGSGYPLGLRGEEIPIECRIMAIVDAYDAMTSARPFRKAKSHADALAELKRCSGTHFDPRLVELFFLGQGDRSLVPKS